MHYLLGVDVGTTHLKAIVFDEKGNEISRSIRNTPSIAFPDGKVDQNPDELWHAVAATIAEAVSEMGGLDDARKIEGLAVASVAEAGVLLDAHGQWLYPIIAWYDLRTVAESNWWRETVGPEDIFAVTGLNADPMYSVTKIMWIKNNHPDAYNKATRWLCTSDYINYRLTGEMAMDLSLASRTMLFDQRKQAWSEEFLSHAGLPITLMPPAVDSGTLVGRVTREAARMTGLPEGIPVFAGGHDHLCGALAAGIIGTGLVLDSIGTAESLLGVTDAPRLSPEVHKMGFGVGHHVVRDKYYIMGGTLSAGASIEWLARTFIANSSGSSNAGAPHGSHAGAAHGGRETETREVKDVYRIIESLARESTPCARGLFFLPHLRGSGPPRRDPMSRGVFLGLRTHHSLADITRATIEGLCLELRSGLQALEAAMGSGVQEIRAIGGGAKNRFWLETKATVLGRPVKLPGNPEAVALGAALLAGIGSGIYKDEADAVRNTYRELGQVEPDGDLQPIYDSAYSIYKSIYPATREISYSIETQLEAKLKELESRLNTIG
ncbi:MAG: carbohydrate kinase [Firmicutes bacterium]|nr:carbohydrate kinase [Bacillota bacterium]